MKTNSKKKFYARIENFDDIQYSTENVILFDCAPDSILKHKDLRPRFKNFQIEYRFKNEVEFEISDHDWYQIEISPKIFDRRTLNYFSNSNNNINILIRKTDQSTNNKLKKIFSISHESSLKDFEKHFRNRFDNLTSIIIADVGQGNCNILMNTDLNCGLFFDFGGDKQVGFNNKLIPKFLKFCDTVILSHWDMDHWRLANNNKFSSVANKTWVVPNLSNLGPSHFKFASKLAHKKNILVWPKNENRIKTSFGYIIKASGKSRNDSGICLHFIYKNNSTTHNVLLPADAKYECIKISNKIKYSGLMIPHHGSKIINIHNIPKAEDNKNGVIKGVALKHFPRLGISYGTNNYGHPNQQTKQLHKNKGWNNLIETNPKGDFFLFNIPIIEKMLLDPKFRKQKMKLLILNEEFEYVFSKLKILRLIGQYC